MNKIGTTKLWIGELNLPKDHYDAPQLQREINQYVTETRRTVTGAFLAKSATLLLLHWPETREGYREQTLDDCDLMQNKLAARLHANNQKYSLSQDEIMCMMGLKIGGYDDGRIAAIDEIAEFQDQLTMEPAHMVSARAKHDGSIESYGEPTALLRGKTDTEEAVHTIGDQLEQYHYGIHRGSGATDFYETRWAQK